MNMKEHILAALRENYESWDHLLSGMDEEEINAPHFDLDWSIKDVVTHLWAWQQISIARMESGVRNQAPEYPKWIRSIGEGWEEDSDRFNALTFKENHGKSWTEIYRNWKSGFLRLLDVGSRISERDLLDGDRYPWLQGHSLAIILVASYDHHQEHYQKLQNWLGSQPTFK